MDNVFDGELPVLPAQALTKEQFSEQYLRPTVQSLVQAWRDGTMTADDWRWWYWLGGPMRVSAEND